VDTQNARIRTASIVTGIEPESAQSGGYFPAGGSWADYGAR
jgi:hypothetical protein